ncbi:MAG: DUF2671 domain-containing protein [Alphaproteobacteria bacterium]
MKKINLTNKYIGLSAPKKTGDAEPEITNMMLDARYLRQSSSLIQDALQKGFDVLQLSNGDIVTTGTKTVVYQYTWDESKGKLVKRKPEISKKGRRISAPVVEDDEELEIEN